MRTIRNVTFVVLCAMVYVSPVNVQAGMLNSECLFAQVDHGVSQSGCTEWWRYQGECDECDLDAYNAAIDYCFLNHRGAVMVEYFCADWPLYEFVCVDPALCWD